MYEEYLCSERAPIADILQRQQVMLRDLLRHAVAEVPFYRDLMSRLGCTLEDLAAPGGFKRIPIVTKAIVRSDPGRFTAGNAAAFQPSRRASSGTTGEPFGYLMSRRARSSQWASMYRQWHVGGWNPGERIVYLGGSSIFPSVHAVERWFYEVLNNWIALSAFEMNPSAMDGWLTRIARVKVRFMHAYPSSAYLLASHAQQTGRKIRFQAVFTSAEVLHPYQRSRIEEVFGCEVFDFYGANDGGAFAYECERHAGLHCVSERAFLEIARADGSTSAPGEVGRLISTDLLNYAMPFIRYDAGDEGAMTSAPCPCGRGLPLLGQIAGRSNDYVQTPSGERIHGGFFSYLVRAKPWVDQFQVVQTAADSLTMYVKPRGPYPAADIAWLEETLRAKCTLMTVGVTVTENIPLAPNGKYQYVVNHTLRGAPRQ
jgi:phenylacetate-CoA ligase